MPFFCQFSKISRFTLMHDQTGVFAPVGQIFLSSIFKFCKTITKCSSTVYSFISETAIDIRRQNVLKRGKMRKCQFFSFYTCKRYLSILLSPSIGIHLHFLTTYLCSILHLLRRWFSNSSEQTTTPEWQPTNGFLKVYPRHQKIKIDGNLANIWGRINRSFASLIS